MGCTPSKQIDASREDSNGTERESSVTEQTTKNEGTNANGNSKNNSNGTGFEKTKSKNEVDAKLNKSRRVLTSSKSEKKCTQSQLDFFEMLDKRIEAGAEYASEDERGSHAWTEKSFFEYISKTKTRNDEELFFNGNMTINNNQHGKRAVVRSHESLRGTILFNEMANEEQHDSSYFGATTSNQKQRQDTMSRIQQ